VNIKIMVFWDIIPYSLVHTKEPTASFFKMERDSTLKMEATGSSKALVPIY
jgi:hypothetical protein